MFIFQEVLFRTGYGWTVVDGLLVVSGTSNNAGLIRVTTSALHGLTTGDSVFYIWS